MLNHRLAQIALRTRARDLSVATTGTTSIAATSTGYTRAAGSFITDGFLPGAEVLAAGFSTAGNNGYKVVKEVAATTLTVQSSTTMSTEAAGGDESIVWGMPETQAWENIATAPAQGRPYIEEDYVPSTHRTITLPAQSASTEERVDYFLRYYGVPGYGHDAIRAFVGALMALFSPGTTVTTSGSQVLRCRTTLGAFASQIVPLDSGWAVCTIQIPLEAETTNVVTA